MNFKKLYKRFYTVRLSLFIITFIITVALLIMSVNFWLEVNSTRKYAKLAIDNSVLQEKINTLLCLWLLFIPSRESGIALLKMFPIAVSALHTYALGVLYIIHLGMD